MGIDALKLWCNEVHHKPTDFRIIQSFMHLFLKEKTVYVLALGDHLTAKLIDFEEDPWRHDCQYAID